MSKQSLCIFFSKKARHPLTLAVDVKHSLPMLPTAFEEYSVGAPP
jgi:hypothetical protein